MKAGAPVEIRLRSDDTDHGFRIVGTDINVTIPKRGKGVATVTFVPPQPGDTCSSARSSAAPAIRSCAGR